mgnify:FL=1
MIYLFKDKFWFYTVSFTLSIIISFPILIILLLSFKTNSEINFSNFFSQFSFDTYKSIWNLEFRSNNNSFKQSLFNSIIVTTGTVALSVFINVLAGYSISLLRVPYRRFIFILLILPFLIPIYSILLPLYVFLYKLNLNDSYLGLIIIYSVYVLPIGFFLMYNSFISIPQSLREVAILNGSSEIKILFLIMLPLVIPGFVTLIIFSVYISWTDYLFAYIIMNSNDMQMLNVTLSKIGFRSNYPYAGYVISYLPFMMVFIFLQKYYFKSISTSFN